MADEDLLGLSEFTYSSKDEDGKDPATLLQQPKWQPSRKSSRSGRVQDKMYKGRVSTQQQQSLPQIQPESPPLVQKPKLQKGGSSSKSPRTNPKKQIKSKSKSKRRQKQRPRQLSKSSLSSAPRKHRALEKRLSKSDLSHERRGAISSDSSSSDEDMGEALYDDPSTKLLHEQRRRGSSPLQGNQPLRRPSLQKSLSSSSHHQMPPLTSLQKRPSLTRRPSLQRRPSIQNDRPQLRRLSVQETSSRSILAGSLKFDEARRNSYSNLFSTVQVPMKDEPQQSERGRSRHEDRYARRRSRSLDEMTIGRHRNDLIPIEKMPLKDKPMYSRRRSNSLDSGSEHASEFFDNDFREELLEKRRASNKETEVRDPTDTKEDLEDRKANIKSELKARTSHSDPAIRAEKLDDDGSMKNKKKRSSMPATTKTNRSNRNSKEEENRKKEVNSDELLGRASPRQRRNRRAIRSTGYARLQASANNSLTKHFKRRRPAPTPTPPAAAAQPPPPPPGVSSRRYSDESDVESFRRKKKRGRFCSRFVMTVLCFLYLFSLVGVFALGFWTHMEFFAYKDTNTTANANMDVSGVAYENNGTDGSVYSGERPMLRPNQTEPTDGVNFDPQSIPIDGELGTKVSQITAAPSISPSSRPTLIFSDTPSSPPTSSSYPSSPPSMSPSKVASESPSSVPTATISETPSISPTSLEECPETLSKSMPFISDTSSSLTLYYETIIYRDHFSKGLLCAAFEYSGATPPGWLGVAFSTAGRNPQFGRREAIIGIPGVATSEAVSAGNVTSQEINPSGNQNNFVEGAPYFVNPAKYEIPAGGLDGYYGPSLTFLMDASHQTLVNASVTTTFTESNETITRLSFAKYLHEPGEIAIEPFNGPTLILYAVAPIDNEGLYINSNPQWKYINMILGGSSSPPRSSLLRKRQHKNFDDDE